VPDDERTRRRLGDETKARIADLSSGWSVDSEDRPASVPEKPPAPRSDETQERIAELASGWSVDPEVSAVPLAPPLGRSQPPSGPAAVRPVTPTSQPATRNPVPAIPAPASGPTAARPVSSTSPPIPDAPSPRKKQKTLPPPPPGSEARRQLETAIVEGKDTPVPVNPARATKPTTPPPPPARGAKPTSPPPLPPGARTKPTTKPPPLPSTISTNAVAGTIGGETGVILLGDAVGAKTGGVERSDRGTGERTAMPFPTTAPTAAPYNPPPARAARVDEIGDDGKLTVPVGEFEDSSTFLEKDKLQIAHAQSTIKRDAASALLGIAEPALTQVKAPPIEMLLTETAEHLRGDPTSVDPSTTKFERGDPTNLGADNTDAAGAASRPYNRGGRLRTVSALRRQRGIFGDVRYVSTAMFGVRHARRELEELEAKQQARQLERKKHMTILGRTAVVSEGFDHPALGPARESLGGVEDERARHRGQVVAADQELERVTRDRQSHAMKYSTDLASINGELAELTKRLEPLLKEQAQVTKRGAELRDQLRRIDMKIQDTTASLVSVRGPKQDPAAIQAELATLKADRVAVHRDEPKIAAELDALNPRIAAIEAKKAESQLRLAELIKDEEDDKRRTEELLSAIGAKRKVMDRAAGDAETLRDKILFELGERLYVDRPDDLGPQLAPVDAIDLELGTHDRRVMELREILSSIDKAKLTRGILVIILVLAAVGGATGWLIYMLA